VANASVKSAGTLHVIATPIGNAGDLGARAANVLQTVSIVAAEDTRRAAQLLARIGSDRSIVSLHEHNETAQIGRLISELEGGKSVALVTDAGTPLISDPGLKLVQAAIGAGLPVVAVPGPSAVTAALSIAGLPTDRFVFEGFLPRRSAGRRARLQELATESRTLVFFEAVHRIEATLADLVMVFGAGRRAALCRELTKLHEQVARASLAELAAELGRSIPLLGEFVIVVEGRTVPAELGDAEVMRLYALLAPEMPPARAVALCARISGRSRNAVYALTRGEGASASRGLHRD
jgi:16S rRNA (cytidine1402-2'-O)-methyltransferase